MRREPRAESEQRAVRGPLFFAALALL